MNLTSFRMSGTTVSMPTFGAPIGQSNQFSDEVFPFDEWGYRWAVALMGHTPSSSTMQSIWGKNYDRQQLKSYGDEYLANLFAKSYEPQQSQSFSDEYLANLSNKNQSDLIAKNLANSFAEYKDKMNSRTRTIDQMISGAGSIVKKYRQGIANAVKTRNDKIYIGEMPDKNLTAIFSIPAMDALKFVYEQMPPEVKNDAKGMLDVMSMDAAQVLRKNFPDGYISWSNWRGELIPIIEAFADRMEYNKRIAWTGTPKQRLDELEKAKVKISVRPITRIEGHEIFVEDPDWLAEYKQGLEDAQKSINEWKGLADEYRVKLAAVPVAQESIDSTLPDYITSAFQPGNIEQFIKNNWPYLAAGFGAILLLKRRKKVSQ